MITLLLALACANTAQSLRIGAFNIKTLGTSKFGNEEVMGYIDQVRVQYSVERNESMYIDVDT